MDPNSGSNVESPTSVVPPTTAANKGSDTSINPIGSEPIPSSGSPSGIDTDVASAVRAAQEAVAPQNPTPGVPTSETPASEQFVNQFGPTGEAQTSSPTTPITNQEPVVGSNLEPNSSPAETAPQPEETPVQALARKIADAFAEYEKAKGNSVKIP